jgi:hypothetical protein
LQHRHQPGCLAHITPFTRRQLTLSGVTMDPWGHPAAHGRASGDSAADRVDDHQGELRPMADTENHRMSSFSGRARSAVSPFGQDDHLKQSVTAAKTVTGRAEDASKAVSRKVAQEDAWEVLPGDVELLTDIARVHDALGDEPHTLRGQAIGELRTASGECAASGAVNK